MCARLIKKSICNWILWITSALPVFDRATAPIDYVETNSAEFPIDVKTFIGYRTFYIS